MQFRGDGYWMGENRSTCFRCLSRKVQSSPHKWIDRGKNMTRNRIYVSVLFVAGFYVAISWAWTNRCSSLRIPACADRKAGSSQEYCNNNRINPDKFHYQLRSFDDSAATVSKCVNGGLFQKYIEICLNQSNHSIHLHNWYNASWHTAKLVCFYADLVKLDGTDLKCIRLFPNFALPFLKYNAQMLQNKQ